ncbi:hypothetical protein LCGC14_1701810 [marine sediment metagenome]|uniref:Uncharacterized protein n=1 Tax=marine sediment metagenome TaxID=412755 RepID=A0A0F9KHR9_9ZZZZ
MMTDETLIAQIHAALPQLKKAISQATEAGLEVWVLVPRSQTTDAKMTITKYFQIAVQRTTEIGT